MITKEQFMDKIGLAIKEKKGIKVFVKIPGNTQEEVIYNHPEDVENKKAYYDKIYGDDMKHLHAPVEIVNIVIS